MLWNFGNYSTSASHTKSLLVVKIHTAILHELSAWKTGGKSVPCTFQNCVLQENQHIFLYAHTWQIKSNSVVMASHVCLEFRVLQHFFLNLPHCMCKTTPCQRSKVGDVRTEWGIKLQKFILFRNLHSFNPKTTMSSLISETLYLSAKIWNPCLLYKVFEGFPKTMFKHNTDSIHLFFYKHSVFWTFVQ